MKKDAVGIIHHANTGDDKFKYGRAYMTSQLFDEMLKDAGLKPLKHTDSWGSKKQFNCKMAQDMITVFKNC